MTVADRRTKVVELKDSIFEGKPISSSTRRQEIEGGERGGSDPGEQGAGGRRRPPWGGDDAGAGEGSFGAWLRRQREMREIDLREIAERTKISLRYLQAMEQDRFELLPAPVFAKGFLREYAKYVGLSPDEVVNYYLSAIGVEDDDEEELETVSPRSTRGRASPWTYGIFLVLLVILLVSVVAYLAFYAESKRRDRRPPPVGAPPGAAATTPASVGASGPDTAPEAAAPTPAAEPAAPLRVTLDFTQECWIELVVDGRERISELHAPGESLQIDAQERVVLASVGNPRGVEVRVNGRPFTLPVVDGRVTRDVVIDLDDPEDGAAADGAAGDTGAATP